MKTSDVILEFLVIGVVSAAGLVVFFYGINLTLPRILFETPTNAAVLGLASIPLLYFWGITTHNLSWAIWQPTLHEYWLRKWSQNLEKNKLFMMAEKVFLDSPVAKVFPDYSEWNTSKRASFVLDWCRFQIFETASEETREQFLRQFHLYRIAYGPLSILVLGILPLTWGVIFTSRPYWNSVLVLAVWLVVAISIHAAWHRATRMWKYLCFSVGAGRANRNNA